MKKSIRVFTLVLLASVFSIVGCDDGDSGTDKYTLSDVTPDVVTVTLDGDLGTLSFDLSEEMLTDGQYDAYVGYVEDGTIALTVLNNDTGVSVNLADGMMVTEAPAAAGEYMIEMEEGVLMMTFFNEVDGLMLRVGGDYTASIDVMDNDEFTTESFNRDVVVE